MKKLLLFLSIFALVACETPSTEKPDNEKPNVEEPDKPEPEKPKPDEPDEPEPEEQGEPFEVKVVSTSSANIVVEVTPREDMGNYFVAVWRQGDVKGDDYNGYADEFIKDYLGRYEEFAVDDYCVFNGQRTIEELYMVYQITKETDYYVAVFEVAPDGEITSDVVVAEAYTTAVEQSELAIEISQISATEDSVKVHFEISEEGTAYFATVIPKSYFSMFGDDVELAKGLMASAGGGAGSVSDMVYTISRNESWGPLPEEEYGYAAVAFGVNENFTEPTTEIFRHGVECADEGTDAPMPSEIIVPDAEFGEVIISDNKSGSVKIAIEPKDKEGLYLYSLVTAEQYDEVASSPEALIMSDYVMFNEVAEARGTSLATYINRESIVGDVPTTTVGVIVEPLTEMVVYVYGVDLETLQPTTKVEEVRFTTPALD